MTLLLRRAHYYLTEVDRNEDDPPYPVFHSHFLFCSRSLLTALAPHLFGYAQDDEDNCAVNSNFNSTFFDMYDRITRLPPHFKIFLEFSPETVKFAKTFLLSVDAFACTSAEDVPYARRLRVCRSVVPLAQEDDPRASSSSSPVPLKKKTKPTLIVTTEVKCEEEHPECSPSVSELLNFVFKSHHSARENFFNELRHIESIYLEDFEFTTAGGPRRPLEEYGLADAAALQNHCFLEALMSSPHIVNNLKELKLAGCEYEDDFELGDGEEEQRPLYRSFNEYFFTTMFCISGAGFNPSVSPFPNLQTLFLNDSTITSEVVSTIAGCCGRTLRNLAYGGEFEDKKEIAMGRALNKFTALRSLKLLLENELPVYYLHVVLAGLYTDEEENKQHEDRPEFVESRKLRVDGACRDDEEERLFIGNSTLETLNLYLYHGIDDFGACIPHFAALRELILQNGTFSLKDSDLIDHFSQLFDPATSNLEVLLLGLTFGHPRQDLGDRVTDEGIKKMFSKHVSPLSNPGMSKQCKLRRLTIGCCGRQEVTGTFVEEIPLSVTTLCLKKTKVGMEKDDSAAKEFVKTVTKLWDERLQRRQLNEPDYDVWYDSCAVLFSSKKD